MALRRVRRGIDRQTVASAFVVTDGRVASVARYDDLAEALDTLGIDYLDETRPEHRWSAVTPKLSSPYSLSRSLPPAGRSYMAKRQWDISLAPSAHLVFRVLGKCSIKRYATRIDICAYMTVGQGIRDDQRITLTVTHSLKLAHRLSLVVAVLIAVVSAAGLMLGSAGLTVLTRIISLALNLLQSLSGFFQSSVHYPLY